MLDERDVYFTICSYRIIFYYEVRYLIIGIETLGFRLNYEPMHDKKAKSHLATQSLKMTGITGSSCLGILIPCVRDLYISRIWDLAPALSITGRETADGDRTSALTTSSKISGFGAYDLSDWLLVSFARRWNSHLEPSDSFKSLVRTHDIEGGISEANENLYRFQFSQPPMQQSYVYLPRAQQYFFLSFHFPSIEA
ncbi:uncharacterized protein BDR25DRAFT_349262 [Lindgomyces ingoldianus]|uniref:Uncharacterized protein n=1 Tax=Lindgomyces ingoldianus TaxID=673940 RepID=A0ACB6RDR9_9PLEO|nr:uncharacterized protein BDR25DRAFT_349262 [Lindgomyces ingoldianus]KAF2477331.1 hypothetical protein BDR25DRAFT_349262 [Lindgomyces ingoldianus]